jgi:hypothetical protein
MSVPVRPPHIGQGGPLLASYPGEDLSNPLRPRAPMLFGALLQNRPAPSALPSRPQPWLAPSLPAGRRAYPGEDLSNPLRPRAPMLFGALLRSHPASARPQGRPMRSAGRALHAAPLIPSPDEDEEDDNDPAASASPSSAPAPSPFDAPPLPELNFTTDPNSYLQPAPSAAPKDDGASQGIGNQAPIFTSSAPSLADQTPPWGDDAPQAPAPPHTSYATDDPLSGTGWSRPNLDEGTQWGLSGPGDGSSAADDGSTSLDTPQPMPRGMAADPYANLGADEDSYLQPAATPDDSSATQDYQAAQQRLDDFTGGRSPYVLQNGTPMKWTHTINGPTLLPISDPDEERQAMGWLNQRAQLRDEVNRLAPAARYEQSQAGDASGDSTSSETPQTAGTSDPLRAGDSQWVSTDKPAKTPEQMEQERVAAQIEAAPAASMSKDDLAQLQSSQMADSLLTLGKFGRDWYAASDHKTYPTVDSYSGPLLHERWKGFENKMKAELDAGNPMAAAIAIRQMYCDMAAGGFFAGEPTAARFLTDWLSNDPSDQSNRTAKIGELTRDEMGKVLNTRNTQDALARSVLKQQPDLATGGAKTVSVNKLILPEITIGESNKDMYHTLGQFTLEFTGTIQKGDPVTENSAMTVPITLNGTFGFKDTYDWADSHGKSVTFKGVTIPDSYANLVEKQGLAKSYPVSGTTHAKINTQVTMAAPTAPEGRK